MTTRFWGDTSAVSDRAKVECFRERNNRFGSFFVGAARWYSPRVFVDYGGGYNVTPFIRVFVSLHAILFIPEAINT